MALLSGLPEGKSPAQRSIDAAVLLELIHTATLIHDDVVDEAKTRRGHPTLGAIFDNRVAVLMGDFILSSALIGAIALRDLEVMAIVSGIGRELTEGEIRQFESADSLRLDEANYYEIIRQKTAVLFASRHYDGGECPRQGATHPDRRVPRDGLPDTRRYLRLLQG